MCEEELKIVINSPIFKLPLLRRYSAIVLGRRCYLKGSDPSETLIRHEMVHQEQMNRVGLFRFYVIYLCNYFWNLARFRDHDRAYREIPFEKEAYARESDQRVLASVNENQAQS